MSTLGAPWRISMKLIQLWSPNNCFSLINFADFSACSLALTSFSICYLLSSLACPWLPWFLPAACCLRPLGLPPAKLMNGYMVLTNGGSQPRSSPSLSSRTLSRPAGDIIVNMDTDPSVRKMDTIVKLDAVSFSLCVFTQVNGVNSSRSLCPDLFTCLCTRVPLLPASSFVC